MKVTKSYLLTHTLNDNLHGKYEWVHIEESISEITSSVSGSGHQYDSRTPKSIEDEHQNHICFHPHHIFKVFAKQYD